MVNGNGLGENETSVEVVFNVNTRVQEAVLQVSQVQLV